MAIWPFRRSRAREDAELLLSAVSQISRQPDFFGEERTPDTLEGRFELMTVHAALALMRLGGDEALAPLGQEFTDVLFRHFDAGLREAAVGDLAVPRRMRSMAGAFYGRFEAYAKALSAGDSLALTEALRRNVLSTPAAEAFAPTLADYMTRTVKKQAEAPAQAMFRLDGWAQAPA